MKLSKYPAPPYKRFRSGGLGVIISNDFQFRGISILLLFWQLNVEFLEAMFLILGFLITWGLSVLI